MRFILIALVLLGLTGCMVLFETVDKPIVYHVRVDNQTAYTVALEIGGLAVTAPPGLSGYYQGETVLLDGDDTAVLSLKSAVEGDPLLWRTSVRVSADGYYTLTIWYDELGPEYRYTWSKD